MMRNICFLLYNLILYNIIYFLLLSLAWSDYIATAAAVRLGLAIRVGPESRTRPHCSEAPRREAA